jgi:hypothetical protein
MDNEWDSRNVFTFSHANYDETNFQKKLKYFNISIKKKMNAIQN